MMLPPGTGQAHDPLTYTPVWVVVLPPEPDEVCVAGAGFWVGIGAPWAPGRIRTWPTTRLGSVRLLSCITASGSTSYFAAIASIVSPACTVITRPLTGGITRSWPWWSESFALR